MHLVRGEKLKAQCMKLTTTFINNRFQVTPNDTSSFLGQGGMGAVYRGMDTITQQDVAVKMLRSDPLIRNPELIRRFEREGEALRQLNHPNIVKMLDACECDGAHYLIMEYVSGGSLRSVLEKEKQLSVQRALYIALDLADALTRAHRLGILHRDIKPDNVLMAEDGTPRLTDFGMARIRTDSHITEDGAIVGTMAYIPPEVFQGQEPDERSDLWSFGIMLYEMLAGQRPFPQMQPAPLINAILTHPVPPIEQVCDDIPTALVDLVHRMLDKNRDARIPTARMVGVELESLIRGATSSLQRVVSPNDSTGRFQINTSEFPPISDIDRIRIPNNLPNQPTAFVGREQELADVTDLFRKGAKLVTLLGSGGVGKTRLALQLAGRNLESFQDGVYFVPLAPLEDASFVVAAIAEEIGYEFSSTDTEGDLLNYLREKRMLLVLDNFEHVTDAAALVGDLLRAAPDVCVVATSRERLRLRGEQVYEVNGMIVPDSMSEHPEWLVQIPAVKLFLQSALRVMPDFAIEDQETAHHVAQVIRLVQGLPLGIELAAAWLEALPLDEIVTEIKRNFDFLETDLRDVPERHRSIRAVFDYSWNLMTPDEQAGFMKLSVFRDGFAREAAQKVADTSLRTLTTLVNKSLLRRDPMGRFYVHEMLRQYAEEKLQQMPDVKMATYKAHGQYYAQFAAELSAAFNTQREPSAVQAMDAEIENVRLMWRNVVEHGHFDLLDDVQDTMLYTYLAHSLLMEGHAAFKKLGDALAAAGQQDDRYWRARIRQAWFATRFGGHEEVVQLCRDAVDYFEGHDLIELSHAHNQMSYAYMARGEYDAAIACSQAALDACKQAATDQPGSRKHVVPWYMSMGNLGYAQFLRGDYRTARETYENVLQAVESMEYSQAGIAYFKNNLGEILRETGEMKQAHRLFQEAYDLFAATQQKRGMGFTLNNLGGLLFLQGQHSEAQEAYQRSYQLNREIGDRLGMAHSLSLLGNVAGTSGEMEMAKAKYRESLGIRRELGDKRGIADSLSDLARADLNTGKFAEAEQLFAEALQIYREIRDRRGEGGALASFALTCLMQGKQEKADSMIREALAIGEEIGSLTVRLQGYIGLGELAMLSGDTETALAQYKLALNATQIEDDLPLGLLLFVLVGVARVRQSTGDTQGAIHLLQLVLRYPRTFIGMVEDRAKMLLEQLQPGSTDVSTKNLQRVSTQELQGVIEALLQGQ